jgi:hypothetical protein
MLHCVLQLGPCSFDVASRVCLQTLGTCTDRPCVVVGVHYMSRGGGVLGVNSSPLCVVYLVLLSVCGSASNTFTNYASVSVNVGLGLFRLILKRRCYLLSAAGHMHDECRRCHVFVVDWSGGGNMAARWARPAISMGYKVHRVSATRGLQLIQDQAALSFSQ